MDFLGGQRLCSCKVGPLARALLVSLSLPRSPKGGEGPLHLGFAALESAERVVEAAAGAARAARAAAASSRTAARAGFGRLYLVGMLAC